MACSERKREIRRRRHRKKEASKARIREQMKLKGTKKPAAATRKKKDAAPAGA